MIRAFGITFLLTVVSVAMYGCGNCPVLHEQYEFRQTQAGEKSNNKNKEKDLPVKNGRHM